MMKITKSGYEEGWRSEKNSDETDKEIQVVNGLKRCKRLGAAEESYESVSVVEWEHVTERDDAGVRENGEKRTGVREVLR